MCVRTRGAAGVLVKRYILYIYIEKKKMKGCILREKERQDEAIEFSLTGAWTN